MDTSTYAAEIAFLNRKLPSANVKWEILAALSQIVSPPLAEGEAQNIVANYKKMLGNKMGIRFNKTIFTVASKLRGGMRIAISVSLLREFFGDEIDGDAGGGGGRGYNPLQTRPGRGSSGI